MSDVNRLIGQRIRAAREAARMSQEELGRKLGLSGSAIGYLEGGIRKAKIEDLPDLAKALKCSVEYFMADTMAPRKPSEDLRVILLRASRLLNPKARLEVERFVESTRFQGGKEFVPAIERNPRLPILALLKRLGITVAPVDVETVAHGLGIDVEYIPLDDAVSALLVIDDARRVIGVNSNHPLARRRFSIAHELAHYWLGHYSSINIDHSDPISGESVSDRIVERQADRFAAELLMPAEWVREDFQQFSSDFTVLAKRYEVSPQAMWIRLVELGLEEA